MSELPPKPAKPVKRNRTLSLTEPGYTEFARYCKSVGYSASEVVDHLIEQHMKRVKK